MEPTFRTLQDRIEPRVLVTGMCAENPKYDERPFNPYKLIDDMSRVFYESDVDHRQVINVERVPGGFHSMAIAKGLSENTYRIIPARDMSPRWEFDPSATHWYREDIKDLTKEQQHEVRNLREEMIRVQEL